MSSRFVFPHAYDPHMHREEVLTLSRTTSQQNGINKVNGKSLSPSPMTAPAPRRRHFAFADPVAFRYLEEDSSTVVIERRGKLKGYELYIVEQWSCSRVHPTFVITTYTGDPNHVVMVGVLGVPADEDLWSPRLRVYFRAISQYHARPKETPLGMLMVTNLSSFPSALTVIPVPDGDVRKHREDYIVNENLKRLGCSGRSGMSLSTPAGATQAKFFQLYKASDRIPLYGAVIELVKLCQVALMIFGKLEQEYADGLLCDVTEKAINDWWTEIGSEYYNVEPTDGILGPTTVSALLGMLMGARNRLNYYGAPVAKDAFDVYNLKRGIAYFQKSQKMEKTRRLDRHTLDRLHRVTAKAAAGEGWAIPKAVKSTVAELSGKGGEMLSSIAGRDKAEIGDIETLDMDRFVSLVHGERAKWLWYGKPRKSGGVSTYGKNDPEGANLSFTKDDQGGYIWSHNRSHSIPPEPVEEEKESPAAVYISPPPGSATSMIDSPLERDQLRKNVFKSVTGKMNDARSGFGRIKDAVGLRGHASKHSKDEGMDTGYVTPNSSATLGQSTGAPASPQMVNKVFTWKETPGQYHNAVPRIKEAPSAPASSTAVQDSESPHSESRVNLPTVVLSPEDQKVAEAEEKWAEQVKDIRRDIVANDPSIAGSVYGDGDLEGPVLEALRDPNNFQTLLHRRHSLSGAFPVMERARNEAWWPRQMSFNDAEEAVLGWEPISVLRDDGDEADTWPALKKQQLIAEDYIHMYEKIAELQDDIGPWVVEKVDNIDGLDNQAAEDQEQFQTLYYQLTEQYQAVKQSSEDVLTDERSHVMESVKDIEVLGAKLEYEINALVSKAQDVEDGVSQFERQVDDLESRAKDLEIQLSTESWPHWLVRSITGIGTGPNIVAPRRNP
ncbi:related to SIN3 protein-binding protein STB2 [Phialocephala subalpina]|uniref:Related to SIN3 protein-binding protein STB2 n=1 Tax=Phialocephala subalpina TaxID=576137 RepID=A0A1L7WRF8_9HELO|nr:related to SIN3 protein-binding protein STB2 [Phialocephala subalpina]